MSTPQTSQVADFRAEALELSALLETLAPADWARETAFKRWTINDVVQHLHIGDIMANASATSAEAFHVLAADIAAWRATGMDRVTETRKRFGDLGGAALARAWLELAMQLCDRMAALDPATRMAWAGPGMGLRMFATARQMETWAHSQAIYDVLGVVRPPASPRLRNIAEIGVRTYAWTFRNRGAEPPGPAPEVRLRTPFGVDWTWEGTGGVISGEAEQFCQVVTQTRNIADTDLTVAGPNATSWMALAQCFAGPPETPPPAGTRFRATR